MGPYLCSATKIGTHALWPKSEFADAAQWLVTLAKVMR